MAHDLTREDLKRNELGEAVEAGVHYAEHHLKAILSALGAVAVVALAGWGVWSWRSGRAEAASELLGRALAAASAEVVTVGAKPDDPTQPTFATAAARDARTRELFERLVADYGSTGAGQAGQLWLAERARVAGDPEEARRRWQAALEGDDGAFAAAARLGLAGLDREQGRAAELEAELRRELESGSGPLPTDVLLNELARTYEALGRGADATATWRRLVDEHGGSPFAAGAREKLTATETPGA